MARPMWMTWFTRLIFCAALICLGMMITAREWGLAALNLGAAIINWPFWKETR